MPCGLQDVAEALRRLPEDVIVARNCRLKRAMDLSMKGTKLPYDLQEKQTPFEHYLQVRQVALQCCSLMYLKFHFSAAGNGKYGLIGAFISQG